MSEQHERALTGDEIAVIGLAVRCPGALTEAELWDNLCRGVDSVQQFSHEFGDAGTTVRAGGLLPDATRFDAARFAMSPQEAALTDPQQRQFLEVACEAFENAGVVPAGRQVGVFAGVSFPSYLLANVWGDGVLDRVGQYPLVVGNDKDHVATRTSYVLDLRGPAVNVQSACSTSLMAVHLACQSLLAGEVDMALAGAAAVAFPERRPYEYVEGGILSPDGRCRPFAADASGTVPGNGVAAVVLKRLTDAQRDGDPVRAVILGSAIGNDGARKLSYTAPAVHGQAAVIREALAVAGVRPEDVGYVEAHGTGTPLGDPIEAAALREALAAPATAPCLVGSVKSNLGHLDVAAGIVGLVKAILVLEHGVVPPSLHATELNPELRFGGTRFDVPHTLVPWPNAATRVAGVSSFGLGGTNAHVVVAEAAASAGVRAVRQWTGKSVSRVVLGPVVVPLSAGSPESLVQFRDRLVAYVGARPGLQPGDVAQGLSRRSPQLFRSALVVRDRDELLASLGTLGPAVGADAPRVAWCFSGAAAPPVAQAHALRDVPDFRDGFDEVMDLVASLAGHEIAVSSAPDDSRWTQPTSALPLLLAAQVGVVGVLRSWGADPAALVGHSVGEYAAAWSAGVMDLPSAVRLVWERARLMEASPRGAMLALVGEDAASVAVAAECGLSVAVLNAPGHVVLSGRVEDIARAEQLAPGHGLEARRLSVATASHSPLVADAARGVGRVAGTVRLGQAHVPYFSGTLGRRAEDHELVDPGYWEQHLREPVRFAEVVGRLAAEVDTVVEIGAAGSTAAHLELGGGFAGGVLATLRHARDTRRTDVEVLLDTVGRLWERGAAVLPPDDAAASARPALPPTPFDGEHHEWRPTAGTGTAARPADTGPAYTTVWERRPALEGTGIRLSGTWAVLGGGARAAQVAALIGAAADRVRCEHVRLGPEGVLAEETVAVLTDRALRGVVVVADQRAGAKHELDLDVLALHVELMTVLSRTGRDTAVVALTRDLADVLGNERPHPSQALLLGPVLVAGREYPQLRTGVIDEDGSEEALEQLVAEVAQVADEAMPRVAREEMVALRGRHRWQRSWRPLRQFEEPAAEVIAGSTGTVLVTGGLGGIGLTVAEECVRRGWTRIALLSRSAPDSVGDEAADEAADQAADQDERLATPPWQAAVRRMRHAGATVSLHGVDVSDAAALREVVARLEAENPLDVVMHAAGVAAGGLMSLRTRDEMGPVLRAKVSGTWCLAQALKGTSARRVVLCSSLDAVLGTWGMVDHVAANAVLDAVPAAGWFEGPEIVSVAWGAWKDVGQAADTTRLGGLSAWRERMLDEALNPATGGRHAVACFFTPLTQVLVSARPPEVMLAASRDTDALDLLATVDEPAVARPRPAGLAPFRAPEDPIGLAVAQAWANTLGLVEVGLDDDYFALGGNSLLAMQLTARLRRTFGLSLPMSAILDRPTPGEQAAWLGNELTRYIDALDDEEVDRLLTRMAGGLEEEIR